MTLNVEHLQAVEKFPRNFKPARFPEHRRGEQEAYRRLAAALDKLKQRTLAIIRRRAGHKGVDIPGLGPVELHELDRAIAEYMEECTGGATSADEWLTSPGILPETLRVNFGVGVENAARTVGRETALSGMRNDLPLRRFLREGYERLSRRGWSCLQDVLYRGEDSVTAIIERGLREGLNPLEISRQLSRRFDAYKRWEFARLARTEVAIAQNEGRREEFKAQGYSELEGVEYPPYHPNSAAPWCTIDCHDGRKRACDIRAGDMVLTHRGRYKRVTAVKVQEYDGLIYEVGRCALTAEHPVATADGWMPIAEAAAKRCSLLQAKPGQDLRLQKLEVLATTRHRQAQDLVALLLQVLIFEPVASPVIPVLMGSAVYLHNLTQWFENEIADVPAHRLLKFVRDVDALKPIVYELLRRWGISAICLRFLQCGLFGCAGAFHRIVAPHSHGVPAIKFAGFFGEALAPRGARAGRYPVVLHCPQYGRIAGRTIVEACGNLLQGPAFAPIAVADIVKKGIRAGETQFCQAGAGGGSYSHAVSIRNLDVRIKRYRGPVYDFEVDEDGTFSSDTLICHNCVCSTTIDPDTGYILPDVASTACWICQAAREEAMARFDAVQNRSASDELGRPTRIGLDAPERNPHRRGISGAFQSAWNCATRSWAIMANVWRADCFDWKPRSILHHLTVSSPSSRKPGKSRRSGLGVNTCKSGWGRTRSGARPNGWLCMRATQPGPALYWWTN